ncbi:MAG: M90 family metallopeptidase [Burkholderiaceae bacterium]
MPDWASTFGRWCDARTLRRRPIPEPLWQLTLARFPFLQRREAAEARRLRELTTLFLAAKEFHGVHGLQVSDEMAVTISAQACLPILHLGLAWYDRFVGIVVHPDIAVARREVTDDAGVVHGYDEELSGEAMDGGPIMLSWTDVSDSAESASSGYNVVIHEFAHVLDMRDGVADGVPPLPDRAGRARWTEVMDAAYAAFCAEVDADRETFLDPYGAESIDEFFAVLSEAFFVAPIEVRAEHTPAYELLRGFYRQDPASELGGR